MLLFVIFLRSQLCMKVPDGSAVKSSSARDSGDASSISGSGRTPGEGNGNPPQYSCLKNPMDHRAWGLQSWAHKNSDTTEHEIDV